MITSPLRTTLLLLLCWLNGHWAEAGGGSRNEPAPARAPPSLLAGLSLLCLTRAHGCMFVLCSGAESTCLESETRGETSELCHHQLTTVQQRVVVVVKKCRVQRYCRSVVQESSVETGSVVQ